MIPWRGQAKFEFSGRLEFVCFVFPRHYSFLITLLHRKFLIALFCGYYGSLSVEGFKGFKPLSGRASRLG